MNLDFLSMEWLEEGALVVDDRSFAKAFSERWQLDMARSRQVTRRDANALLRPVAGLDPPRAAASGTRPKEEIAMAGVKPIPEGMHTVTPNLVIRDCAKAIDFYKRALGAQEMARACQRRMGRASGTPSCESGTRWCS